MGHQLLGWENGLERWQGCWMDFQVRLRPAGLT
jgi:hypothetical protein